MFAVSTATWITIALLAPVWWAIGLTFVALLADIADPRRDLVSRFFDRLEGTPPASTAIRRHGAALST